MDDPVSVSELARGFPEDNSLVVLLILVIGEGTGVCIVVCPNEEVPGCLELVFEEIPDPEEAALLANIRCMPSDAKAPGSTSRAIQTDSKASKEARPASSKRILKTRMIQQLPRLV